MTIAPDLPAPGVQSTEDRRQISRRFIIHAREELAKNNRLQAGEKAWGAVVQPLKAIAELRGWQHQSHRDVYAVALQVAQEYSFDVYQVNALADAYRVGHENFYENYRSLDELADMIDRVESLVPYLNRLTDMPPRQVRIASNAQLRNLRQITGNNNLRIGDTSSVGFSRTILLPTMATAARHQTTQAKTIQFDAVAPICVKSNHQPTPREEVPFPCPLPRTASSLP